VRPHPREATARESVDIWPAVRSERIFDTAEQFAANRAESPWSVRVTERGEAAVLGVWRRHLDVLAMRGVFCSSSHIGVFVADARGLARERGLARVLSPLLPVDLLGPYLRERMQLSQRITAIQGHSRSVLPADAPLGATIRAGTVADLPAVTALDAVCFDEFWRYGPAEIDELFGAERLAVAQNDDGQLIGYTLATVSRGTATLGRLGVAPSARGHGVGRALVSDVARWAESLGAEVLSLCTQEENSAARRLYQATGLAEVRDVYGFAMGDVAEKGSA
jgi:[ribosomal protein S18]-alanine N-acetyltransferase